MVAIVRVRVRSRGELERALSDALRPDGAREPGAIPVLIVDFSRVARGGA